MSDFTTKGKHDESFSKRNEHQPKEERHTERKQVLEHNWSALADFDEKAKQPIRANRSDEV